MARISYSLTGVNSALLAYQREERASSRRVGRFLRSSAGHAREAFAAQFASGGSAFGLAWARKKKGAGRTLEDTGDLRRSTSEKGALHFERIRGTELVLESLRTARNGESLVEVHARTVPARRIVHPQTGIAGRQLQIIEAEWDELWDQIARRMNNE